MAEQLLKIPDVAKRLNCSPALVYALCAEGKLPHVRLGLGRGTIRVPEDGLQTFLKRALQGTVKSEGRHIR